MYRCGARPLKGINTAYEKGLTDLRRKEKQGADIIKWYTCGSKE